MFFSIVLVCFILVNSKISAQIFYHKTLYELAKSTERNEKAHIDVDINPNSIGMEAFDSDSGFVSNENYDTVFVVSGDNKAWIKNILVGESPQAIDIETTDVYTKKKINEKHSKKLGNEFPIPYDRIFRKRIKYFKNSSNKIGSKQQIYKLKVGIDISGPEQKITEKQLDLLNEKILGEIYKHDNS